MSSVNLRPYAFLTAFLFIRAYQIAEVLTCICKQLVHIFTACKPKQLTVCKQNLIIFFICSVNNKSSRQIINNILHCKTKLCAALYMLTLTICHAAVLPTHFHLIKCHVCTPHELWTVISQNRILRKAQWNGKCMRFTFTIKIPGFFCKYVISQNIHSFNLYILYYVRFFNIYYSGFVLIFKKFCGCGK